METGVVTARRTAVPMRSRSFSSPPAMVRTSSNSDGRKAGRANQKQAAVQLVDHRQTPPADIRVDSQARGWHQPGQRKRARRLVGDCPQFAQNLLLAVGVQHGSESDEGIDPCAQRRRPPGRSTRLWASPLRTASEQRRATTRPASSPQECDGRARAHGRSSRRPASAP